MTLSTDAIECSVVSSSPETVHTPWSALMSLLLTENVATMLDDLIEGGFKRSAAMQDCLHALHYVVKWSATGNDEPHPGRAAEPTQESGDSRGCDTVQVKLELEVVSKLHCRPD